MRRRPSVVFKGGEPAFTLDHDGVTSSARMLRCLQQDLTHHATRTHQQLPLHTVFMMRGGCRCGFNHGVSTDSQYCPYPACCLPAL